jgi:hypothetical protein
MKSESERESVVEAVLRLRDAAEAHGRAEQEALHNRAVAAQLHALNTRIATDESMARAVAACTTCGRMHCDDHD